MKKGNLPPRVGKIENGSVEWARIHGVDYEILGYFLSCHLILEHYLDELLRAKCDELSWDIVRLNFNQKLLLLEKQKLPPKYQFMSALKHLNILRNKFSHSLAFELTPQHLEPFVNYLKNLTPEEKQLPTETIEILEAFTGSVCAFLAGWIYSDADSKHRLGPLKKLLR